MDLGEEEIRELLRQRRKAKEEAAAAERAEGAGLGDIFAGLLGASADAMTGGEQNYTGKVISGLEGRRKAASDKRIKALDAADLEIKSLTDLARLRQQDKVAERRHRETLAKMEHKEQNPVTKQNQHAAAGFATRAEQAENVFNELAQLGHDPTTLGSATQRLGLFPEAWKSGTSKRQAQAENNFVTAVLRKESGATISPAEFEMAEKLYFPRAGDDPATLAQKAETRRAALASLKAEGGPALQSVSTQLAGLPQAQLPVQPGTGLIPNAQAGQEAMVKVVNGRTYIKVPGGWKGL
jgi:hypothetical protein